MVSRAIGQEVATVWIEFNRTDVCPGRKRKDGVGLSIAPQLYCAVITAGGKERRFLRAVRDRPDSPAVLLYIYQIVIRVASTAVYLV